VIALQQQTAKGEQISAVCDAFDAPADKEVNKIIYLYRSPYERWH
jgi:hypothetical protein